MLATYGSVLAIAAAAAAVGQAALTLSGWRRCSWLAPAVGLALLTALCWATVRLPGDGAISAAAAAAAALASAVFLRGRVEGVREALRSGAPVALLALAAASLPFLVEGRFGILGTSFNPDMSQHLLAADRLAHGADAALLSQGYPLGPHAIVVALDKGLGVGLVQGFGGLTLAIAVIASLAALEALADLGPLRRTLGALLVGLTYLVASYLAQGAFKETMQALFVLAFAIALWRLSRQQQGRPAPLAAVPLGVIAAGSVFAYSFPGLLWPFVALAIWGGLETLRVRGTPGGAAALLRTGWSLGWPAAVVFAVLVAPEIGRMLDFRHFETFDPAGAGLGNLFGQISPFEALGLWPSGDFRLSPGDGAVPAIGFYAGVALALALLGYSLAWWLRRGETAIPAALAAAVAAYAAARLGGTPYTAAKAVQMAAPLAALAIVRPLLDFEPARLRPGSLGEVLRPAAGAAFAVGAAGCSLLALANGPVGPRDYSPALTGLRPQLAGTSTLVLAPRDFLAEEHGTPYVAWELRGGRVCIAPEGGAVAREAEPPPGVGFVVTWRGSGTRPPFAGLDLARRAGPYLLWRRPGRAGGPSPCPLIAVREARQGEKQDS